MSESKKTETTTTTLKKKTAKAVEKPVVGVVFSTTPPTPPKEETGSPLVNTQQETPKAEETGSPLKEKGGSSSFSTLMGCVRMTHLLLGVLFLLVFLLLGWWLFSSDSSEDTVGSVAAAPSQEQVTSTGSSQTTVPVTSGTEAAVTSPEVAQEQCSFIPTGFKKPTDEAHCVSLAKEVKRKCSVQVAEYYGETCCRYLQLSLQDEVNSCQLLVENLP